MTFMTIPGPTMSNPRPVALITGAARRIGAVIATRLHAEGYDLALHFRDSASEAAMLQDRLEGRRRNSTALLRADLTDSARLPSLVERTMVRFGRLDVLVNNASSFFPSPVGETSLTMWNALMDTNAKAPFFLAQAAAPHLRQARGAILNLSDIYAERPLAQHTAYCMAKAALSMLTLSLASELAPDVRVNAIAPGAILWPESGGKLAAKDELIARTPLKRSGTPEEIAEAAVFLIKHSQFTTGEILRVDGGRWLEI